jgi:hypothetical protein
VIYTIIKNHTNHLQTAKSTKKKDFMNTNEIIREYLNTRNSISTKTVDGIKRIPPKLTTLN